MIIGRGDIASVLPERDDLCFFASGVSNSQEERELEYDREKSLLLDCNRNLHLVYFGSLSIFYSNSRYARHKKEMEKLVKDRFPQYTIIRIGNITWGSNPNTLINHFKEMARSCEPLDIQDTTRYVVEKDEFLHWINLIPAWPCEINIPGRLMTVQQIVDTYVAPEFYLNA
jgi:hypothetical protein